MDNSWICTSYPFRRKTKLHCAEKKAKVDGEWAMQHLNLQILYVFLYFVFVFTTNSVLSTRQDLTCSFHFGELSLRNR